MPKYAMSDARMFTDYNPSCELNNHIRKKHNITGLHEYRAFLQNKAEDLMKEFAETIGEQETKLCPVCKLAVEQK